MDYEHAYLYLIMHVFFCLLCYIIDQVNKTNLKRVKEEITHREHKLDVKKSITGILNCKFKLTNKRLGIQTGLI